MSEQITTNQFLERKPGDSPWSLRKELGQTMWERAGIVRDGEKLKTALTEIASLQKRLG